MKENKQSLKLEGLGCAHCASKIEQAVSDMDMVKEAHLDFVTKKLTVEVHNAKHMKTALAEAEQIAHRIESGLTIIHAEDDVTSQEEIRLEKKMILFVGISISILAILSLTKPDLYIALPLYLLAYILVGGDVLIRAGKNIARGQVFDENFLMALATVGAFAIKEFPEAVSVMIFYQVGEFFQDLAVHRSRKSISDLMDIRPDFAMVRVDNGFIRCNPADVAIGSEVLVKPGERIPLDGIVIEGSAALDTSALTGESAPREVSASDEVLAGFINKTGVLTIRVSKAFGESTVSKILDLVQNASSKKAQTEKFITKFAKYYTPAVVLSAAALAFLPPLFLPGASFSDWMYRALVFLVVSCPCALVISIPLGFFGGIGGASKHGILIKGSNFLEALNQVETVVFDKTGTLTKGAFEVTRVQPSDGFSASEVLQMAAFGESYSNHPIALSILKAYAHPVEHDQLSDYQEVSGKGVQVRFENQLIQVGNSLFMKENQIPTPSTTLVGTLVYVASNGQYAGLICIEDMVKPDSAEAIRKLSRLGVQKTVMLTGDRRSVAESVGKSLNIGTVFSELLPHEKVEKLELLESQKSSKGKLVFIGDGINDAPVLARADIGIAMGGLGSDAAIEAADIVLMTDEPSKLVTAILIARKTNRIVWQNIVFALGIKAVVLLLGALGMANMWAAVFADVGVALIAVLNAMRAMGHYEAV